MKITTPKPTYFTGLDLGQTQEFTAVAVLEKTRVADPEAPGRHVNHYAVRHLERFPLGTAYAEIGARLAQMFAAAPLTSSVLTVDQTAVGKPVLDLFRRAGIRAQLRPVTITAGHQASQDGKGGWLVPKKELVSTLQVLLQSRQLKVAPTLPEAQTLVEELTRFQVKVTTPDDTVLAWREWPQDDLVLATAIAAWQGERCRTLEVFVPYAVGGIGWAP